MNRIVAAFHRWFHPSDRRAHIRQRVPLFAFYWSGGPVRPHKLTNISAGGAFIQTTDFWSLGTVMQIRIQNEEQDRADTEPLKKPHQGLSWSLQAAVMRKEPTGMAVQFLFETESEEKQFQQFLDATQNTGHTIRNGMYGVLKNNTGHSLVEFALLIPLLFLLIVNAVNFGGFFYTWITIANAARSGSQYQIMSGATINSPKQPTATQIYNTLNQDIASLPNRSSLAVRACTNTNGTISCASAGAGGASFTNPPADTRPEASLHVMSWVDVQYTFQPLIPSFHFPGLGIHGTLPPTTVYRQSVMRMLQ